MGDVGACGYAGFVEFLEADESVVGWVLRVSVISFIL